MSIARRLVDAPLELLGVKLVRLASFKWMLREVRRSSKRSGQVKQKQDKLRHRAKRWKAETQKHRTELALGVRAQKKLQRELEEKEVRIQMLERELRDAVQGELDRMFDLLASQGR